MAMPASFQSAKLLVVDGVAENRRLPVRRLQRHGRADVATPSDGMEALDALPIARVEARPFDVVLLDVMMPRMSGMEILKTLRPKRRSPPYPS